jgi:protein involved in polysaccharide export with SLBB domain
LVVPALLCLLAVPSRVRAQSVVTPATATQAQAVAATLGRSVSNAEIARAIRESGLSADDVRARLRGAGFDPSLADPFFGGSGGRDSTATAAYAKAFRSIGVLPVAEPAAGTSGVVALVERDSGRASPGSVSRVFGKNIFRRGNTTFDPVGGGPVDASYRIGAGDQLQVVLLGDVELAYQLDVRRDGTLLIPQVGQVPVAGLTLDGARALVRQRAGRSYSGLVAGTTQLDLTVSRVRTNAVFVIGEVEDPGVHQVSALASAFHAIARAGGPTENGSFREIEVRRGGSVLRKLDLYRYLLNGDATQDLRLEQGDVIFVPLSARRVSMDGAVRRPLEFELLSAETLLDLVSFAGGLTPEASLDRLQIDRILPPAERTPGFDRVRIDVRVDGRLDRVGRFALQGGDRVSVFQVGELRRNTIRITGAVYRPGEYQFSAGLSLDSLISLAQGIQPFARQDRVIVRRLIRPTGRVQSITVNRGAGSAPFPLDEFDQVDVLDARVDFPQLEVSVAGAVNRAGAVPFLEGESLRDLFERVGGFREGADSVEVSRRRRSRGFTDTTSIVYRFSREEISTGRLDGRFTVEPADAVEARFSPGYRPQRFVRLEGAFINTGNFAITENADRISTVVARAGGLQPNAYGGSLQLRRAGLPVAVDYEGVRRRDPGYDLLLRDGDVLQVSTDPRTVRVEGGVLRPSLIRFDPSLSVADYIDRAGGPTEKARVSATVVTSANGLSQRSKRRLGVWTHYPEVGSGATIFVPEKAPVTVAGDSFTKVFQITSALASLIIAWAAATR